MNWRPQRGQRPRCVGARFSHPHHPHRPHRRSGATVQRRHRVGARSSRPHCGNAAPTLRQCRAHIAAMPRPHCGNAAPTLRQCRAHIAAMPFRAVASPGTAGRAGETTSPLRALPRRCDDRNVRADRHVTHGGQGVRDDLAPTALRPMPALPTDVATVDGHPRVRAPGHFGRHDTALNQNHARAEVAPLCVSNKAFPAYAPFRPVSVTPSMK
jgi:hypothetical protein